MTNPINYSIPTGPGYGIAPKRKMSTGKKIGIGVAVLFGLGVVANVGGNDGTPQTSGTSSIFTSPTTLAPATPSGPQSSFGPGTYLTGTQIEAGTYQSQGGSNCYWERQSSTSGSFDAIIANDWSTDNSPQIVTIDPTDVAFKSSGCGTWTKIG